MRSRTGILLLLALSFAVRAQDSLSLAFRQDNLTSTTDFKLAWAFPLENGRIETDNRLSYKLFQSRSTLDPEYSFEDRFALDYLRPAFGEAEAGLRLEYDLFSDRRTGLGSDLSTAAVLATINQGSQHSAGIGLRNSRRFGLEEVGPRLYLRSGLQQQMDNQNLNARIDGNADFFETNENYQLNALFGYQVNFADRASLRTMLSRRERQQQFFTDSARSSQSRTILDVHWQNMFSYAISEHLGWFYRLNYVEQATGILRWRETADEREKVSDEDRSHISLLNESGFAFNRPGMQGELAFRVENSQNKYYVDYNQVFYQLSSRLSVQPGTWVDTLSWRGSIVRQQYDTPDTTNDDDRDELRITNSLVASWRPSPFLKVAVGTKLNLFHLVYLFNTRSSENHWNRSLILWNEVDWVHGPWKSMSTGRVHANYFDYDFDDLFVEFDQPRRSFVHRSLELEEILTRRINPNWSLTGRVDLKWEDDGQLDWSAFVQEVQSSRHHQEFVLQSRHRIHHWEFWYGYLVHSREQRYSDPNRSKERLEGQGPLLGWRRYWSSNLHFSADLRLIQVHEQDRDYRLPKFMIRASWLP